METMDFRLGRASQSGAQDGCTGKAGTTSLVGVASEHKDGRTGKARTPSTVGVASERLRPVAQPS